MAAWDDVEKCGSFVPGLKKVNACQIRVLLPSINMHQGVSE